MFRPNSKVFQELVNGYISNQDKVFIFLTNGVKLVGTIHAMDDMCIAVKDKDATEAFPIILDNVTTIRKAS